LFLTRNRQQPFESFHFHAIRRAFIRRSPAKHRASCQLALSIQRNRLQIGFIPRKRRHHPPQFIHGHEPRILAPLLMPCVHPPLQILDLSPLHASTNAPPSLFAGRRHCPRRTNRDQSRQCDSSDSHLNRTPTHHSPLLRKRPVHDFLPNLSFHLYCGTRSLA